MAWLKVNTRIGLIFGRNYLNYIITTISDTFNGFGGKAVGQGCFFYLFVIFLR